MKMKKTPGSDWRLSASGASPADRLRVESSKHVFDELVVDDWIHLERMSPRQWWMRLGEVDFDISIEPNGKPKIAVRNGIITPMGGDENLLKVKP